MVTAGTRVVSGYLPNTPKANRETGGRKFFTQPIIDRIQEMGRTGKAVFDPKILAEFRPRFDSPPYPISDMLVADSPSAHQAAADLSFSLGEKTYSAPVIFGEFSLGATQEEVHRAVAGVAQAQNLLFGVGEGGVAPSIAENPNLMVQVATGLFGISAAMLRNAAVISIKMSQSAKIGMGGHLPKAKVTKLIREIRGMPGGIDILSDASRVFSIEEMRALVQAVKAVTGKPVLIKVGASHSIESVAAGAARSGADGIIIDGRGGGTGAAPSILRDHIGMPIELAVRLAHRQIESIGMRDKFRIIAAGRVDLPEKAFKIILLGADGVMLATGALIALGCKVVNMCHKDCPVAITAIKALPDGTRKKSLEVQWASEVFGNFAGAFRAELGLMLGSWGFASPGQARGRADLLHAVDMPYALAGALGIRAEKRGQIHPVPAARPQQYFSELLENLAETGKPTISSMGRTTDLDPPYSHLDHLTQDGRTVVGPAYDSHRETIETVVRLPGGTIIGLPVILEGGGQQTRMLAKEMNIIVFGSGEMEDSRHALLPIKPESMAENLYRIRESSGVVLPSEEVTADAIRLLRLYSPKTAVYTAIKAGAGVREEAVRLARLGANGIIIEGGLSMDEEVPIDVAVSQAHDALVSEVDNENGRILRNEVKLFARAAIRSSRDIYGLNCLGADAVICNASGLISNPTYGRQLNLLRGLRAEDQMLMGASGLSMMSSVIGNREILRADHYLPEEKAALLGVGYIGT